MKRPARTSRAVTACVALLALAVVLLGASGCARAAADAPEGATGATPRRQLMVFAASSLRAVLESTAPEFEAEHDVDVVFNFAASGVLQKQIEVSAPADVFVSANAAQVASLATSGLTSGAPSAVAANSIVLARRSGTTAPPLAPGDLADLELLAIGDPETTPHGAMAKAYLESLGVWDALAGRLTLGANAEQTLAHVSAGEVDAGFIFATQATATPGVETLFAVPADAVPPSIIVATALADAEQPDAAAAYVEFLTASEVQQALTAAGFLPAPE